MRLSSYLSTLSDFAASPPLETTAMLALALCLALLLTRIALGYRAARVTTVSDDRLDPIQQVHLHSFNRRSTDPKPGTTDTVATFTTANGNRSDSLENQPTQLHISALESALEEQSALVAELRARLAREIAEFKHGDIQRMLLTITGLREAMAADPAAEPALSRVEAAICRLVSPHVVDQPALPRTEVAVVARTPRQPAADGVVLPVPAALKEEPSTRGRRWLRHTTAA